MAPEPWVDLPKSDTDTAFVARLAVALDGVERGDHRVTVRFAPTTPPDDGRLMVLGPDDPTVMIEAVEAGAAGYLPMSRSIDSIVDGILSVSSGQAVVPEEMLGALLRRVVERNRRPELPRSLTEREGEVFRLAARGLDKFGIARQLGMSPATARTHLANIMAKLDVRSRAELVAVAASIGIDTTPEQT